MNKLVKGAIAGASGFALLLGGAGTFASWESHTTFTSHVTSGHMEIASLSGLSAVYAGTHTAVDYIVPGDSVVLTQPVRITVRGSSLHASLGITAPGLDASTLKGNVAWSAVQAYDNDTHTLYTDTSNLSAAQAASIDSVKVTLTFNKWAANDTQDQTIDLNAVKVTLTQKVA